MQGSKSLAISFLYFILKICINKEVLQETHGVVSDEIIIIIRAAFINVRGWDDEEFINEFIQNRMIIALLVVLNIQNMIWGSVPGRTSIRGFHIEEIK